MGTPKNIQPTEALKPTPPIYSEEKQIKTHHQDLSSLPEIIKVFGLFDSHYPETISIRPLLKFVKDYDPDIFILGGDNWSLDCVSHWNESRFKNWGFDNIVTELNKQAAGFAEQINRLRESAPRAIFKYILGNHEKWILDFCESFPQIRKITVKTLLGLDFIDFIPQGSFYKVGKLTFCHGDQFKSANPAKWAVERCNANVVFGHFHTRKEWPDHSMVDADEKHMGIQVPCYTTSAPEYGGGSPNQIQQGFFTASIKRDSGKFSHHVQLVSPHGEFISQMGKEYV